MAPKSSVIKEDSQHFDFKSHNSRLSAITTGA